MQWFMQPAQCVFYEWAHNSFSTYARAVLDAQSECQTEKRPRRITAGFYELRANGHHVFIGTLAGFASQGYPIASTNKPK